MSGKKKPTPAPKTRDYSKALDGLTQLESQMLSDDSPLTKSLREYMRPYDEQAKAGKLNKKQYEAIGGQFVNDWASKNLFNNEGVPSDEELKGPILQLEKQRRAQLAASDPRNQGLPPPAAPADEGFGSLDRQAKAVSLLRSLLPPPQPPTPPQQQPMPRMQVKSQTEAEDLPLATNAQYAGGRMPMPYTVTDPYGRPIDSPAQQLNSPNMAEIDQRVKEGQQMTGQLQQQYARANDMPEFQFAELPVDASQDEQLSDAQLRMLMDLARRANGK